MKDYGDSSTVKPYLRWAGGKNWLIKHIDKFIPINFYQYHEPFVGGGSIFFFLKNSTIIKRQSYLSDQNKELINSYAVIKDQPHELIGALRWLKNDKSFYYEIRSKKVIDPVENAARFIFLNRTSFNGIYRENLKGIYNVPYGNKQYSQLFDFENIIKLSTLLKDTTLRCGDFANTLPEIEKLDLVFLDPPYTVAHQNNNFVKYNQKIFSWNDQIRLREFTDNITRKGSFFILTNAYDPSIRELFVNGNILHELSRASVIGGTGASRKIIKEYLITNF